MAEDIADDRLETIAVIWNRPELQTFVAMLDAHGIPVFVSGEWHASVEPYSVALGGHEVRVPTAFMGQATAISASLDLEQPIEGSQSVRARLWQFLGVCFGLPTLYVLITGLGAGVLVPAIGWPMTRGVNRTRNGLDGEEF